MPGPLTQQAIEGYPSLPLPKTWAETIGLKNYWERKAAEEEALRQLTPCEVEWSGLDEPDPFEQDWLPGYDITDDQ